VVLRANRKVSHFCTACDTEAERSEARPWANQEQLVVCSADHARPSCVAFSSPRDEEGRATRLALSFGADGLVRSLGEVTVFSVSREFTLEGQRQLVFP
jgi:hypothetical protein